MPWPRICRRRQRWKRHAFLIYTRVLSPITGRIGRSLITEGALVTANQVTALATVHQLDPVYVDVTQPITTLLRLKSKAAAGLLMSSIAPVAAASKFWRFPCNGCLTSK